MDSTLIKCRTVQYTSSLSSKLGTPPTYSLCQEKKWRTPRPISPLKDSLSFAPSQEFSSSWWCSSCAYLQLLKTYSGMVSQQLWDTNNSLLLPDAENPQWLQSSEDKNRNVLPVSVSGATDSGRGVGVFCAAHQRALQSCLGDVSREGKQKSLRNHCSAGS